VQEVIAYDLHYNHPITYACLLEQAEWDATAELTAEAKNKISASTCTNYEDLRKKAVEELKDSIDWEMKAWGVIYRAQKLTVLEATMDAVVTNDEKQVVYLAALKLGITLQEGAKPAWPPKTQKHQRPPHRPQLPSLRMMQQWATNAQHSVAVARAACFF
jgi:hypothetical protein